MTRNGDGSGTSAIPAVPGLLLERPLGSGEHAEVWQALDTATRGAAAVLVGRPVGSPDASAREGALLRRVDHENVVRLRSVLDLPDGRRALVTDLASGGDLPALVGRRGPLAVGEVVTLTVALARALEHVHARGFVHGRLSARDVLFAEDGRPVVTGVGVPFLLAPRLAPRGSATAPIAYPSPAHDVLALGRIVRFALSGGDSSAEVTGPLAPVAAACTAADADARPLPARVAALAREAAPAEPIALALLLSPDGARRAGPGGVPANRPRTRPADRLSATTWTRTRTRVLVLVPGGALALALVMGSVLLAAHRQEHARPEVGRVVPPASANPLADPLADPQVVVAALASARARALTAASEPALAAVDAPGSAAVAADAALVRRLHGGGVRLRGLAFDVSDTQLEEADTAHAIVRAQVSTSPYEEVGVGGNVLRRVPASPPRTVRLALVATPGGWRITSDG